MKLGVLAVLVLGLGLGCAPHRSVQDKPRYAAEGGSLGTPAAYLSLTECPGDLVGSDALCALLGFRQHSKPGAAHPAATPPRAEPRDIAAEIQQRGRELQPALSALVRTYARLQSLHARAHVLIAQADNRGRSRSSTVMTYEYWESGARYRSRCDLDPRLEVLLFPELAFDGKLFQVVARGGLRTVLCIATGDRRTNPMLVRNPLLLPLFFLNPEDRDRCPLCDLRLADLQPWADASAAPPVQASGRPLVVLGGRHYGEPTRFEVTLDSDGQVSQVRHLSPQGSSLETLSLWQYEGGTASPLRIPRRINFVCHDPGGGPDLEIKYYVDLLESSAEPWPARTFQLGTDAADRVWNAAAGRWR
jgi:hypothetical protein